ncbi:MAG: CxxxxCH/CxxCH domain-containing protein [Geobacter sp.]|nr:CxxxxCH/CxxCH domain-containing protein [Geobacter sp.]
MNKAYNVTAKTGYSYTYTFNAAGGTCAGISCHFNGTAQWGAGSFTCSSCHGFPPNTYAHAAHIQNSGLLTQAYGNAEDASNAANYAFGCGNCHPTNAAQHINGTLEVSLDPADGGTLKSKNAATASRTGTGAATVCNQIYCHSNGADGASSNLTLAASPRWDTPLSGNKCAACHGNPPQYASAGRGAAGANSHYNETGLMGKEGGHMLTIHRDNIYNKVAGSGLLTVGSTTDSSHGNASVATTMACYVCHSGITGKTAGTAGDLIDTYSMEGTASGFRCGACHNAGTPTKLQSGSITDKSKHVNGSPDIIFAAITMKSKAQLRTGSLPTQWTRNGDYGTSGSYDSTAALLNTGSWSAGSKSCTVACHNNAPVTWGDGGANCNTCHTGL